MLDEIASNRIPDASPPSLAVPCAVAQTKQQPDDQLWHRRLGHLGMDNVHLLSSKGLATGIPPIMATGPAQPCSICDASKMPRLPFPTAAPAARTPLDLLHMDLCSTGILTSA